MAVTGIIGDGVLILSLDTTTRAASCALARDGVVVREDAIDPSRQLALQLPGALDALLMLADAELREIDAFAVVTGPGSFTGLRVGIATMQGLAFADEKPLIGISGLTALSAVAAPAFLSSRIATWIDAWRGDVYAALYEDSCAVGEPVVASPADLLDAMAPHSVLAANDILFIGDGAETYRDMILGRLGQAARIAEPASPLLAGVAARLATIDYRNGHRPPPHAIRPLYVRRPDAELARESSPGKAVPGEPDKAVPGEPDKAIPGEPDKAIPGEPDKAIPGEPDKAIPGEPDKARPTVAKTQ